jgi:hypothetical protein
LQIVFVGINRTIPTLAALQFIGNEAKMIPQSQFCPGQDCSDYWILSLGQNSVIQKVLSTQVFRERPEDAVRRLIQLEIDHPDDSRKVGGPIEILRIEASGTAWIQNENCPPIMPPVRTKK